MEAYRKVLLVCVAVACGDSVAVATAQQHDEVAQGLFDRGREAMRDADYERACQLFRDSDQLEPAVGAKLNLADCEERRGRLATAWQLFRRVVSSLPAGDDRVTIARNRAAALEARVSKLTVTLAAAAPAATTIGVDGVPLPAIKIGVPLVLDPGEHEIVAFALGRLARSRRIRLEQGENRSLELAPGGADTTRSTAVGSNETSSGAEKRTLGFVAGGVGAASLGLAAITGAMVLGKKSTVDDHCDAQRRCDSSGASAAQDGRTLQTLTNIGLVLGVLGLGAGAYLILASDHADGAQTRVAFAPTAGGATAAVLGRW